VHAPDRLCVRDCDAAQFAAEGGVSSDQQRFGLGRHRVDDEASAGPQRVHGGVNVIGRPAADENGIG
jgi:hypothetical protein